MSLLAVTPRASRAESWSKVLDKALLSDAGLRPRIDASELLLDAGFPALSESVLTSALQSKQDSIPPNDLRRILRLSEDLLKDQNSEILRSVLVAAIPQSRLELKDRPVLLWALARTKFLQNSSTGHQEVIRIVKELESADASPEWLALGYQMRGASYAVSGALGSALSDFIKCRDIAASLEGTNWEDLSFRCTASLARVLYEQKKYSEAEQVWDQIPKRSFMWTEILVEQAWSAFSRGDYNRALGKLAAYASPHLRFVVRSDVGMLRGLSLLALCRYREIQPVLLETDRLLSPVTAAMDRLEQRNAGDLLAYFESGRKALQAPLHSSDPTRKILNRLVRSPAFQAAVEAESRRAVELKRLRRSSLKVASTSVRELVAEVDALNESNRQIQGAMIRSGLQDLRSEFMQDADQISFIRLEMLKHVREQLLAQIQGRSALERTVGKVKPAVQDHQYFFEFNSEYWNDELGDYVFGLESQCSGGVS